MTPPRFVAQAALAVWLLGDSGCSLVLATDGEQCSVDADCAARGAAFAGTVCADHVCQTKDPKWGCIGSVPQLQSGGMVAVSVQFSDLISGSPITTGLGVNLCSKLDPGCTSPLGTPTVDAMGNLSVMVKSDFDGYLSVTDSTSNYIPAYIFLDPVVIGQNADILLIPKGAETELATQAMVAIDPAGALLLVRTVDCTGKRTEGVTVSLSPKGKETGFYVINNALVTTATQTDSAGNSGFVNVAAPTTVTVSGKVAASGVELGQITTLVRPGSMTYQLLRPTPKP
jgi:hypothetical protein